MSEPTHDCGYPSCVEDITMRANLCGAWRYPATPEVLRMLAAELDPPDAPSVVLQLAGGSVTYTAGLVLRMVANAIEGAT